MERQLDHESYVSYVSYLCWWQVLGLATQGRIGIAQASLPHMPEGLEVDELVAAIEATKDGICVAFQDEFLAQACSPSSSPQP